VSAYCHEYTEEQVHAIFRDPAAHAGKVHLIDKRTLRAHVTPYLFGRDQKNIEPDFLILVLDIARKNALIIELKDGDMFDTKKAAGEIANMQKYAAALTAKIGFGVSVDWRVCCFNQNDQQAIVKGFKNQFTVDHAMTGQQFCELVRLDYDDIRKQRKAWTLDNRAAFAQMLLDVPNAKQAILGALRAPPEGWVNPWIGRVKEVVKNS
jgi:hypothetical protein